MQKEEIARTYKELPELKKDYIRVVHRTSSQDTEEALLKPNSGLTYKGNLGFTVRDFSDPDEAKDYILHRRADGVKFGSQGRYIIVFDVPVKEHRRHFQPNAPGKLSSRYLVGIIDAGKPGGLEKTLLILGGVSLIVSLGFFTGITGNVIGAQINNNSGGIITIIVCVLCFAMFYFRGRGRK